MKKIILSVLALIIALMSTAVAVFGWLTVGTQIQPNYTGSVLSSYFASGDGLTKEKAFEINRPNHLYNLAWLQNNGYFGSTQYYFEITDNLNMSGYVLPPIGTKAKPFIGILDGNKKTISNLTVSNVEADSSKPNEVSPVPKNISKNVIGDGYTDIVGFFGVIGHYPGADTCPENVSVSNLYLDNLTVRTRTKNTLIGLFAGYVCGNVSNVGVYRSMVSIGSGVNTLGAINEDISFSNHSNYALIGDFDKNSTGWKDTESGSSGGEEGAGFGGSIDMQLLSRRVGYMITSMMEKNTNTSSSSSYNYQVTYDTDTMSSGAFLDAASNYNLNIYKGGNITTVADSGFYYKSGSLTATSNKYLECFLGNKTYLPLNIDLGAMYLSNTDSSKNKETPTTLTIGTNNCTYYYNDIYKDGITVGENKVRKESVSSTNTGYIVGGAGGDTYTSSSFVRLRISPLNYGSGQTIYKSLGYTYSSDSYSGTVKYNDDGSNLDLVTYMDDGFYRIKDDYNKSVSTHVITYTEVDVSTGSKTKPTNYFVRYDDVRDQLHTLLKNENSLIYGLRFNKKWVIERSDYATSTDTTTMNKLKVEGKNVGIGDKTYDSYEFIKSAINFNLSQSGYMTAILGGYRSGTDNQYAFSIYQVDRENETNTDGTENEKKKIINSVTEIKSIWINDAAGTAIKNSDILYNKTSNSSGDGKYIENNVTYTKVYDSNWYNEDWTDDNSKKHYGKVDPGTAYYVEIPLKSGDYCLGGVADDSYYSAYLMYLDIGANGAEGGSSGGETETTYTIESVRFVYLLNGAYDTLSDFYAFQIVRNETGVNNSGVQIYFLMTSSAMCYYKDPIYDTANTEVNLTDATLSVTTNDSSLKTDYGVTTYPPSKTNS